MLPLGNPDYYCYLTTKRTKERDILSASRQLYLFNGSLGEPRRTMILRVLPGYSLLLGNVPCR